MKSITAELNGQFRLFAGEARDYFGHFAKFTSWDWLCYILWVSTISSLFVGVTAFLAFGKASGVEFPDYVWNIPLGVGMFVIALAVDTIGHRTIYKDQLAKGEGYVHHMIIVSAVTSVMALCLCYQHPETMRMPALTLILLSLFYSAIDEALHWHRYLRFGIDRIEMWSHFVAILGHVLMISTWWYWYDHGYAGVMATLQALP